MSAHWWSDWPKFLPGYLAFGATVYTQGQAIIVRRHRRRLGPADAAVREHLTTTRSLLEDIIHQGRLSNWYLADERRETARKLRDLAERRADARLTSSLTAIADAWDKAFASAPPPSIYFGWAGNVPTPQELAKEAEEQAQYERQAEAAREGLEQVKTAFDRLNDLEHRTTGR